MQRQSTAERFWAKVDRTGDCWVWTASRTKLGYGKFGRSGRRGGWAFATRVVWELTYGPIPVGLYVLHRCDNPPCVRPVHLFLGTKADNSADMAQKGRSTKGDRNPTRLYPERVQRGESRWNARVTDAIVTEMRRRYDAGGVTQVEIARQFGLDFRLVHLIVRRKGWLHVV